MLRRVEEPLPQRRDPQVIWSGDEALQLPKLSGGRGFDRKSSRRSDFTEIEIPAILTPFTPANELHPPQTNSSYQLFPTKNPSPIPPAPSNTTSQYQEQALQPRAAKKIAQDSILPVKNLRNMYMNHSAIIRESARRDSPRLHSERSSPVWGSKAPSLYPYASTCVPQCQASAPWVVEHQLPGPLGDNSLTALQMAKSLSEVDFFPMDPRNPSTPCQRPGQRNGPIMPAERGYSWETEVGTHSLTITDRHLRTGYLLIVGLTEMLLSFNRCHRNLCQNQY